MCNEKDDKKDEFKQFIDIVQEKPTSQMRPVKEGFSLDLLTDTYQEKNDNK